MPFSWFGGSSSNPPSAQHSDLSGGRGHRRKVSLGPSSSGVQSTRLADVRAKTKSSYLRKELAQSGELSTSRGRRSTHSTHSTHSNPTNRMMMRNQAIVAVEPDSDYSEQGRRIDQGLIDASRESQNLVLEPQCKSSWWGLTFSAPTSAPQASHLSQIAPMPVHPTIETGGNTASSATAKHRRTVSYNKTYRVP